MKAVDADVAKPIVVRAGKVRDEHLRDLKSNTGRLLEDVDEVMRTIHSRQHLSHDNRVFVPVIVIYSDGTGEPA
jgi:hypothetical protein